MPKPPTPTVHVPYTPPQPTLEPCPGCGAVVLTQLASWEETRCDDPKSGKPKRIKVPVYVPQEPPVNPLTGSPHSCEESLAWELRRHGLRWNMAQAQRAHEACEVALQEARQGENPWLIP